MDQNLNLCTSTNRIHESKAVFFFSLRRECLREYSEKYTKVKSVYRAEIAII